MPYFCIETNQPVNPATNQQLLKKTSTFIADILGKPESYVMVSIQPEKSLVFGGTDDPAAFVRLKSIGLPTERCPELAQKICSLVEQEIGVPKDRIFIDFKDLERSLFGWNGKTF